MNWRRYGLAALAAAAVVMLVVAMALLANRSGDRDSNGARETNPAPVTGPSGPGAGASQPAKPPSAHSGPTRPADNCPLYVLWREGALTGDTGVILVTVAEGRQQAHFEPAAGYEMTFFDADVPFALVGGDRISRTTIAMPGRLGWLQVCARERQPQPEVPVQPTTVTVRV